MPLNELQGFTRTAGANRTAFVTVNVDDKADREVVRDELQATYPEYGIRTSDDQLAAMVTDQILVVASAITLVGLSIVGEVALTANLFVLVIYQQRGTFAVLRAIGFS